MTSTFLINYAHAQTCNAKTLRKVDLSVARIITIGNSGRQFPEQKGTELKKYCSQNAAYLKEIERYKGKCMKGLSKQIASILIYSIKNSIAQLCNKDSKNEYYRIFPCIITKTKRIPVCTEQHVDTAMNFVRSMLGNAIDLLCSEYSEGSDKCDTLGRPPLNT
ncbi:unnamed protein product [Medioppia subpectinata]|uniref:Uncharacterized protein n=1 Tax=Medioppia subpectinata TaxID=1979941 RepID=A0A7R9KTF7_9ACAR|nr:unnamed protein product [Medioppia subpectinata]CAG2108300.1 unnamed protein product [Medioppia subpectinata]